MHTVSPTLLEAKVINIWKFLMQTILIKATAELHTCACGASAHTRTHRQIPTRIYILRSVATLSASAQHPHTQYTCAHAVLPQQMDKNSKISHWNSSYACHMQSSREMCQKSTVRDGDDGGGGSDSVGVGEMCTPCPLLTPKYANWKPIALVKFAINSCLCVSGKCCCMLEWFEKFMFVVFIAVLS